MGLVSNSNTGKVEYLIDLESKSGEGGSYPIYERVITEEDFQNYKTSYKGNEDDEYLDIISLINNEQINGNINLNNYRCFIDGANLSNRFIIFKNGEILFDSMEGGCGKALELNNAFIIFDDTAIRAPQLEDSSTAAIELNTNSNLTFKNLNIEAMFSNDKSFVKFNDENSRLELENITSNIICNEDLSGEDANFEFGFIYVDENNNSVSFKNCNRIRIANDQADDDAEIQCYFIRTAQNKTIRVEGYNSTIVMHGRGNGQVFDVNLDNDNIEVSNNDFQGSLTARFETSEETLGDKLQDFPTTIEMGEYWDIGEWEGENFAMRVRVNETFTAESFVDYIEKMQQYIEPISKFIYSFNNNSIRRTDGYGYLFTSDANAIATREIIFQDGGFKVSGLMEARDGQALVFNGSEFRPQDINGGGESKVINIQGDEAYINVVGNTDYEIEDELSKLTINSNGGLKEIENNARVDENPNGSKFLDCYNNKYVLSHFFGLFVSQDLQNWQQIYEFNENPVVVGNNIIINGNKVFDANDFSKSPIELNDVIKEHSFLQIVRKDGYIYAHQNNNKYIVKFKDDFENFEYSLITDELDVDIYSFGFDEIRNKYYIVFHKAHETDEIRLYDNINNLSDYEVFTTINDNTNIYYQKGDFAFYFTWAKVVWTNDGWQTQHEQEQGGYAFDRDKDTFVNFGDIIYYTSQHEDVKLYARPINDFGIRTEIADDNIISNNTCNGITTDNNQVIFAGKKLVSYSAPQPYPRTETNIYFRTGQEIEFNYPNDLKWTNEVITELEPYTEYEMNIRRGIATLSKVVSQQ